MSKKIVGLMLVKANSKRLPKKNTLDFHGKPMYQVNLEKCLQIFDEVYISSEDYEILDYAQILGAIPILRPEKLCGETPNILVYKHAMRTMKSYGFVAVQANSPTIEPRIIIKAKQYLENGGTEVMTCYPMGHDNPIYGSVWGMTKDRLKHYKDPYKPEPDFLIDDLSRDIHLESDYYRALEES